MSVKKNNNSGGNAIKKEKETAFALLLNRLEKICFLKKFRESKSETPSKPGSTILFNHKNIVCTGFDRSM